MGNMKFLVSNNTFSFTGGSETYAYCVISALKRHGYDVDAFTTGEVTMVGDEIRKLGVNILQQNYIRFMMLHYHPIYLPQNIHIK